LLVLERIGGSFRYCLNGIHALMIHFVWVEMRGLGEIDFMSILIC